MKAVVFDLDGTISDSSEGILRSFNYALEKVGKEKIKMKEVYQYIGPPLYSSFSKILKSDDKDYVNQVVDYFREDYRKTGYKMNKLYKGIYDLIENLHKDYMLFIATTKKKDMAINVLNKFDLIDFFKEVYGGGSVISKSEMLEMIMDKYKLLPNELVMIGDTHFDIEGAKSKNIYSIGVKWGFGDFKEILKADRIAEQPSDIL